ncbi:MAG: class I SAM-dependent RNA methyltransferase [Streptosporangiales bacterium]
MLELDVEAVAHGGFCVARHEGQVVFVRHALPGERVRARVTETAKRYLRADCVEVLVAAPERVEPPCPYAGPGLCGGCDWQHASLPAQRELKAAVVAEQLQRLAGVDVPVRVEEVPGAPDGLGWRTRVRFAVDGEGRPGFRAHRSHEVVPVAACAIAHPAVESLGVEQRTWPHVREVTAVGSADTGETLLETTPGKGSRHRVQERAAGRTWQVTGSGFWQVHPGAADALADAVLAALEPEPGESALDLYAGVGLFSGVLAERLGPGGRVTAIEHARQTAADARHNLADLPTVQVHQGDVLAVLRRLRLRRADLVVLDPPRTGAGRDVVDALARTRTRRVAYVSCDPATLARDIGYFAGHGWHLTGLRAFDLFPMTQHVECLAVLEPGSPQGARGRRDDRVGNLP